MSRVPAYSMRSVFYILNTKSRCELNYKEIGKNVLVRKCLDAYGGYEDIVKAIDTQYSRICVSADDSKTWLCNEQLGRN